MKHKGLIFIVLTLMALFGAPVALAQSASEAATAAQLVANVGEADPRKEKLEAFLRFHRSPVSGDAGHFVAEADRLGLDWRLVAAILGVESTFGRHIPPGSYNGWGWGVFTGASDGMHFAGWKDGITKVSEGLRYNYVDRGAVSIEQIGRIYAASPRWAGNVRFFMDRIENFTPNQAELLDITI